MKKICLNFDERERFLVHHNNVHVCPPSPMQNDCQYLPDSIFHQWFYHFSRGVWWLFSWYHCVKCTWYHGSCPRPNDWFRWKTSQNINGHVHRYWFVRSYRCQHSTRREWRKIVERWRVSNRQHSTLKHNICQNQEVWFVETGRNPVWSSVSQSAGLDDWWHDVCGPLWKCPWRPCIWLGCPTQTGLSLFRCHEFLRRLWTREVCWNWNSTWRITVWCHRDL